MNWQPISTAPIDEFVLVFQPHNKKRKWTGQIFGAVQRRPKIWISFGIGDTDIKGTLITPPTHWMPLPTPP